MVLQLEGLKLEDLKLKVLTAQEQVNARRLSLRRLSQLPSPSQAARPEAEQQAVTPPLAATPQNAVTPPTPLAEVLPHPTLTKYNPDVALGCNPGCKASTLHPMYQVRAGGPGGINTASPPRGAKGTPLPSVPGTPPPSEAVE